MTPLEARPVLTVLEAAGMLGISRNLAYEGIRRGEIPSLKIGRRILVPRVALERLLAAQLQEAQAPEARR